jgi:integrase
MRRSRRAGVEDRWTKTVRDEQGNEQTVPGTRHGIGLRWRARYVDDEGHERSKQFARKVDAQRWLDNEITAKLATGTYVAPEAGKVTVRAVYKSWAAAQGHITPRTAAIRQGAWTNRVEPVWGDVAVVDVKPSSVRAWVAKMASDETTGPATIENAFGVLRQVMGAALEDNRIPRNPCLGVQLPKRQHADRGYLTHAQVGALAAAVECLPEVVRFLAYTGLRWGEMAALRVGDFDMLRRRVNVSRSVTEFNGLLWSTPKSWERRSVPFPASLADELSALMVGKDRDDLVFMNTSGNVLRGSNYRKLFAAAVGKCQKADDSFPTVTPHDLRHTAASLAVSAGANVKAVQRMLGHAKASMTLDVYADLFDDDLDGVAARLDAAIRSCAKSPAVPLRSQPVD